MSSWMTTTMTSSSSSPHSIAGWSRLPGDILGMVLKRLTVADYVRAGSVCTSWHLVAMEQLHHPNSPSLWLLIPRQHRELESLCLTLDFLSFPEQKQHQILLPISLERYIFVGSSHGWLFIQTCNTNKLHLLNPLTGSHHCLPPLMSNDHNMHDYTFVHKAILMWPCFLTSHPLQPLCPGLHYYTVVIIYGHTQRSLAFTRRGDESWTALETPFAGFWDVASHDGLIYAVTGCQGLVTCDITHPSSPVVACAVLPVQAYPINARYHLVSSASSGTLLLVHSRRWCCSSMEMGIEVFELDAGSSRWRKVESLGDLTMFVSSQSSSSLDMAASTELRRNCIYFTNKRPPYEIGVLDLVEGKMEIYSLKTTGTELCSPFWFLPSLK